MVTVQVKHAGKKYEVEVNLEEPGLVFKNQLYSLTGVIPERQKILVKGGQLKDDTDMSTLGLKENQILMMLGSAGELPKAPVAKTQFVEDMTDLQLAQASGANREPNGLINTGNTCYANSTLQALRTVPELIEALEKYKGSNSIVNNLKNLYLGMKLTTNAVRPILFLQTLRTVFPQFDERAPEGYHQQQDAEELWSQLMNVLRTNLQTSDENSNLIDQYFGGEFQTELKCTEADDVSTSTESFIKLDCHISISTNFMKDGLKDGLVEKLEKHNEALGRNAEYTLTKKISKLPKYLTVHYMRFFWRRDTAKKSKILRKVGFPFTYDATDLCTEGLQKKLIPARDTYYEVGKEREEIIRESKRAKYSDLQAKKDETEEAAKKVKDEREAAFKQRILDSIDPELRNDPAANPLGIYELSAVITHQGSSADSGHYQCFVRSDKDKSIWWRFNDDKVSQVDDNKIETLAGGGESDAALVLLYRAVHID